MYFSEWQKLREEKTQNLPVIKKEKKNKVTNKIPSEPSDYEHYPIGLV